MSLIHYLIPTDSVWYFRVQSESSSSETSPLTPPRPLHPPSAFSDSRELSEAECDREILQAQASNASDVSQIRGRSTVGPGCSGNMTAKLTVLLQRYEKQQQEQQNVQQNHQPKLHHGTQKCPYSINV